MPSEYIHVIPDFEDLKLPETTLVIEQSLDGKVKRNYYVQKPWIADDLIFKGVRKTIQKVPYMVPVPTENGDVVYKETKEYRWILCSDTDLIVMGINDTTENVGYLYGVHRVVMGTDHLTKEGIINTISKQEYTTFIVTNPVLNESVRVGRIVKEYDHVDVFNIGSGGYQEAFLYLNSIGCYKVDILADPSTVAVLAEQKMIDNILVIINPASIGDVSSMWDINFGNLQAIDCRLLEDRRVAIKYSINK